MLNDLLLPFQIFFSKDIVLNIYIMNWFIILKHNILLFVISIYKITNICVEFSTIHCMLNIPIMFFCNLLKNWNCIWIIISSAFIDW